MIDSLSEYVLVDSRRVSVETYVKQGDFFVQQSIANKLDSVVELASIGCALPLREIYANLQLSPQD